MKKIIFALLGTISGIVLLFNYHTSTNQSTSAAPAGGASAAPRTSSPATPTPTARAPNGSATASPQTAGDAAAFQDGTYTGSAAETQWGTVQVEITVSGGEITSAKTVQQPDGNSRDQEINSVAVPQLNSAVVSAQSASIDMVSGATVTSTGYVESLQSAIDQARA